MTSTQTQCRVDTIAMLDAASSCGPASLIAPVPRRPITLMRKKRQHGHPQQNHNMATLQPLSEEAVFSDNVAVGNGLPHRRSSLSRKTHRSAPYQSPTLPRLPVATAFAGGAQTELDTSAQTEQVDKEPPRTAPAPAILETALEARKAARPLSVSVSLEPDGLVDHAQAERNLCIAGLGISSAALSESRSYEPPRRTRTPSSHSHSSSLDSCAGPFSGRLLSPHWKPTAELVRDEEDDALHDALRVGSFATSPNEDHVGVLPPPVRAASRGSASSKARTQRVSCSSTAGIALAPPSVIECIRSPLSPIARSRHLRNPIERKLQQTNAAFESSLLCFDHASPDEVMNSPSDDAAVRGRPCRPVATTKRSVSLAGLPESKLLQKFLKSGGAASLLDYLESQAEEQQPAEQPLVDHMDCTS